MPSQDYYLPRRQLVSQQDSAITEPPRVPRSRFHNRWARKTTFDAGDLVPFMLEEIYPGDHMQYRVTAHVRMNTPLFPMFDDQRVDTFFFFVPMRLLWDNWQRFMGEQVTGPAQALPATLPTITSPVGGYDRRTLFDHFALPTAGQIGATETLTHNVLPLRAYNQIYNQWFRDQNLIDAANADTDDGPDLPTDFILRKRAKSHDYFTSALPWPQKFTAPTIPLSGLAPLQGLGMESAATAIAATSFYETARGLVNYPTSQETGLGTPNRIVLETDSITGLPKTYADLSQVTGVSINTFRQAFLVQQLLERDARSGTRYVEHIKGHFGVTSPDFRLQRPEYIGGGQTGLNLTPIAQTAPTTGVPLGALGATGIASGQHRASYAATEHGYIIGIINVRSELSYYQGMHRFWRRSTRYDFYLPSLAQLGEQVVYRGEIYAVGNSNDNLTFGYQERWQELRTRYNEVTGQFRPNHVANIDEWHLAQIFSAPPVLGPTFIEDTPPMDRVLAAGATALGMQYLADIHIERIAVRPIPAFGTPATLGRF